MEQVRDSLTFALSREREKLSRSFDFFSRFLCSSLLLIIPTCVHIWYI